MDEIFNIPYNDAKEFEEQVANKIKSVFKTFDGDRYLSAALLNDRFLKSAQVNKTIFFDKSFFRTFVLKILLVIKINSVVWN